MHPVPGMDRQWKWPQKPNEIWYNAVNQLVALPTPLLCGRITRAGSFNFEENLNLRLIFYLYLFLLVTL